jgi:hypothetical protein
MELHCLIRAGRQSGRSLSTGGAKNFQDSMLSKSTLGLWVRSPGLRVPGNETHFSLTNSTELKKNACLCIYSPICFS